MILTYQIQKLFFLSKNISNYKINIDIKSDQFKEKIIEVETKLSLNSTINKDEKIKTKIVYSTIIELERRISKTKKIWKK